MAKYIVISMSVPIQTHEIDADTTPSVDPITGRLKFSNKGEVIAEFVNWSNWRRKEDHVG